MRLTFHVRAETYRAPSPPDHPTSLHETQLKQPFQLPMQFRQFSQRAFLW